MDEVLLLAGCYQETHYRKLLDRKTLDTLSGSIPQEEPLSVPFRVKASPSKWSRLVKAAAAVTPSRFIVAPAATRGRIATEGGDVRGGVKRALSVRAPASRTGSNCGNLDALGGHSTAEARAPSRLRRSYHEFVAARVLCSRPRHR